MITEVRHFIFQEADVQRALATFRRNRGEPLPPGHVAGMRIDRKGDKICCILDIDCDSNGQRTPYAFMDDEILPAMISYCIEKHVPLPAKSPKFLKVFGDQLGFIVPINVNETGLRRLQEAYF